MRGTAIGTVKTDGIDPVSIEYHVSHIQKLLVRIGWPDCRQLMRDMVDHLVILAHFHDTTLRDCVQQAYDVIAKRTGNMVNGVFVKDQS
jgi:hypothetical protein